MADRFDTHGDFSWCELLTRNVDGSKKFYKELLGWTMEDVLTGDGSYTILRANGRPIGGSTVPLGNIRYSKQCRYNRTKSTTARSKNFSTSDRRPRCQVLRIRRPAGSSYFYHKL
jgi:hypothetical protein